MLLAAALLALQITGSEFVYTVKPKDTLSSVAAQVGVDARILAQANQLKSAAKLKPGQTLKVVNRHIVPASDDVDLVINIPQRMLFHFIPDQPPAAYPVAAGKVDWETPVGPFTIDTKEEDPAWDVPSSIQEEMRKEGKPVVKRMDPQDPENPLGEYWIGLNKPGLGIHGTNAPSSLYNLRTHGCVRLHPDNIRALFSEVSVGMKGRIIYEPVLLARDGNSVFVEIHPDLYKKNIDPLKTIVEQAFIRGVVPMLDLSLVREAIRKREGIARDVTLR